MNLGGNMDQQEVFEFIRNNLTIAVSDRGELGSKYQTIDIKLLLRDPKTDEYEEISRDSLTLYKD